jgi:Domain of unknown function (DUF4476)
MKRLILVVAIGIICSTGAEAQCKLKVSLKDKTQISVAVDGRYFRKLGTSVTVNDLPEGLHRLKIFVTEVNSFGMEHEELLFQGRVNTHYGKITYFEYDRGQDFADVWYDDLSNFNPPPPPYPPVHNEPNNGGYNNSNNYDNSGNRNSNNYDNNGYRNTPPDNAKNNTNTTPVPATSLDDEKLNRIKEKVAVKKTETDKMQILKDELEGETISTAQIATMMTWLNFESTKVELAKWVYYKAVDKENYGTLESKLTFKEYVEELDAFIKSK